MLNFRNILLVAGLGMVLGSCSLFSKTATSNSSESVRADVSAPAASRGVRQSIPDPPPTAGQRPDKATLCGGRWDILAAGTTTIEGEDELPYIEFEDGSGRFYAYDGCNYINGDYLLRTDGAMVFSNVISTTRYCPDNQWNAAIAARINDNARLYVDTQRIGHETYLYLRSADRRVVMTLRRQNMEFLNGNWVVTAIEGNRLDDKDCTIFFDIAELKVHGNTGCNYFNGKIYINPNLSNAVDFSDLSTTRKACQNRDRELRMMVALESTVTAIEGRRDNTVLLLNADGREMMTLKRAAQ